MKTTLTRVLPIVLVGGMGVAVGALVPRLALKSSEQRAVAAEARAISAEKERAATEADLVLAQRQLSAAQAKLAELETREQADAARREAKRQANAAAKQINRATEIADGSAKTASAEDWRAAVSDPDMMRRMNEQARLQVNRRYAALFDQLALSPEQREQLIKLLVDKRQVAADVAAATWAEGAAPKDDPATYADMIAANRDDLEKQIHALLGDADYHAYQAFNQGVGQAKVISQYNQLLAEISQPLTSDQTGRLQATMQANSTARVTGKVVKDATNYLTSAQMAVLRDLRAIQQGNAKKRNAPAAPLPTGP